jgi:hypothetical protein
MTFSEHMKCAKCDCGYRKNECPFMNGQYAATRFPDMMKDKTFALDGEMVYSTVAICIHCIQKAFEDVTYPPIIWASDHADQYRWIFGVEEDEARNDGFNPAL